MTHIVAEDFLFHHPKHSISSLIRVIDSFFNPLKKSLSDMKSDLSLMIEEDRYPFWFTKGLKDQNLVEFFYLFEDDDLPRLFPRLLSGYEYLGTIESLVQVCYGVFGMDSHIEISENQNHEMMISVDNTSVNFFQKGLSIRQQRYLKAVSADDRQHEIQTGEKKMTGWILAQDFTKMTQHSFSYFFQWFIMENIPFDIIINHEKLENDREIKKMRRR